jgi:hypothetical protein
MNHPRRISAEPEALALCSTAHGTALRCSCCGCVEVTFGNAVLSLGLADLDSVLEIIDSFDVDRAPDPFPERRGFLIRTQHDDAAFAFSKAEVVELRELLHGARTAMQRTDVLATAAPRVSNATHILH